MSDIQQLGQALVNFLAWFMAPFAVFIVVEWVAGLFRHDD